MGFNLAFKELNVSFWRILKAETFHSSLQNFTLCVPVNTEPPVTKAGV
jgi:hypothetical protein